MPVREWFRFLIWRECRIEGDNASEEKDIDNIVNFGIHT
jgi:hypothetical protein